MTAQNRTVLNEEFLTTGDVAKYCKVTSNAVKKWISEGKLLAFQSPGGHFRIFKNDFKAFLKATRFPIDPTFFGNNEKKVLVVDDDATISELIVALLNEMGSQYVVESAEDGYEALIKLGAFEPDLIIIDVRMPKIDGLEVLKRIKENPHMKYLKILVLTGFLEEKEKLLEVGVDDFLLKPVKLRFLRQKIETLLESEQSPESFFFHEGNEAQ
jgi:excisionase family DNA binding protein